MGLRVVTATMFYPRGGSAFVTRALAQGLVDAGAELELVAGSRHDRGELEDARGFYRGLSLHEVDFTPSLSCADPVAYEPRPGTAPLQPSFEARPGAADRAFFTLDDATYERHVAAWAAALERAGAGRADVLHLHHLTPLHEAAARVAPGVPIVAHIHGTELLMLEAIAEGGPAACGPHTATWARRLRRWAAASSRLVVAPGNSHRAAALLDVAPSRLATLANGYDPRLFAPREVDRRAVWQRVLVDEPRGWRPGGEPGSVRYEAGALDDMARGPVLVYSGRFTEVKRLPLLLEAFGAARAQSGTPASLVLIGGHPGEWEGEHPLETIERLGLDDVYLAGWHGQDELPELLAAADLLVLPSVRESFGQVIVEAMACGVAPIAAASLGPASIIRNGQTGWLFDVDDAEALTRALAHAAADPAERARRAVLARADAQERFTWPALAARLGRVLRRAADPSVTPDPAGLPVLPVVRSLSPSAGREPEASPTA